MTTKLVRLLVEGCRVAREGTTLERLQWVERVEGMLDALSDRQGLKYELEGDDLPRAGTAIADALLEKLTRCQCGKPVDDCCAYCGVGFCAQHLDDVGSHKVCGPCLDNMERVLYGQG